MSYPQRYSRLSMQPAVMVTDENGTEHDAFDIRETKIEEESFTRSETQTDGDGNEITVPVTDTGFTVWVWKNATNRAGNGFRFRTLMTESEADALARDLVSRIA